MDHGQRGAPKRDLAGNAEDLRWPVLHYWLGFGRAATGGRAGDVAQRAQGRDLQLRASWPVRHLSPGYLLVRRLTGRLLDRRGAEDGHRDLAVRLPDADLAVRGLVEGEAAFRTVAHPEPLGAIALLPNPPVATIAQAPGDLHGAVLPERLDGRGTVRQFHLPNLADELALHIVGAERQPIVPGDSRCRHQQACNEHHGCQNGSHWDPPVL